MPEKLLKDYTVSIGRGGKHMVNMDEIKGKLNKVSGELTDDQMQVLKGHIQESIGKSKESGENSLNDLSRIINGKIKGFKCKNRD